MIVPHQGAGRPSGAQRIGVVQCITIRQPKACGSDQGHTRPDWTPVLAHTGPGRVYPDPGAPAPAGSPAERRWAIVRREQAQHWFTRRPSSPPAAITASSPGGRGDSSIGGSLFWGRSRRDRETIILKFMVGHPLASSRAVPKALLRWIRVKGYGDQALRCPSN